MNVLNKLACSRRSDSRAQDKNSRRKKNEGRELSLSLSRSREETFHVVVQKCTKKRDARANLLFQPISVLTSVCVNVKVERNCACTFYARMQVMITRQSA